MQKILLTVLAATALVGSVAPASAAAEPKAKSERISTKELNAGTYEVDHFNYEISKWWSDGQDWGVNHDGWGAMLVGCTDEFYMPSKLVVPDEITVDGVKIPVRMIRMDSNVGLDKVKTLTLGKNVQIFYSFNAPNLETVNLNEGLRIISGNAFSNSKITAFIVPSTVRFIGRNTCYGCQLKELQFVNSAVEDEYGLTIGDFAFSGVNTIYEVTLPKQTVNVSPSAFSHMAALRAILVDKDCRNMRSDSGVLFQKAGDSYNAVCYPAGRNSDSYFFPEFMNGGHILPYFCIQKSNNDNQSQTLLKKFDFSKLSAPIVIEPNAIEASAVEEVTMVNVDSIMDTGMTVGAPMINVGKDVRYIDPIAFGAGCKSFSVDAENTYYKQGEDNTLLKVVDCGLELVRAPVGAYTTKYTVPDGTDALGPKCFWFCNNLEEVTLNDGLKRIGEDAFYGDRKLKKINYRGNQLDYIAATALFGFNSAPWFDTQADGGVYFGNVLYRWKGVADENTVVSVKAGTRVLSPYSLSSYVTPSSYTTSETKNMKTVNLPNSLEKIYEYAFYHNNNLTSVNIPSGVTFIGDHAFCQTGLEKVVIPDNVTMIGAAAFNATPATEVTIGSYASDKAQTIIGADAFSSMTKVTKLLIGGNVTEIGDLAFMSVANQAEKPISVEIPSSVTSIGYGAFTGSNIDKLRIGAGVKSVGTGAFCCFEEGIYDDEWQQIGTNCSLKEIHIEALTPPAVYMKYETDDISLFTEAVYAKLPLFVPVGKVADYRAAEGWNKFARILNEGDEDSIESISADSRASIAAGNGCISVDAPADMPVVVASLSGTILHSGHGSATIAVDPGIYIVRAGSDTVKLTVR